ncbi:predicted protein [Lichtheimia corymbifera JMRC:FSU:9682]|uniref:Uncharacterized protein n=1 Tax=Lichtheimia corymbifera JMRC:FSU:9682 TaxID=1263082 RepID=A0A068RY80_9FUNG|nr:predicted protein [Lichtheimia corymbifera JMRC:FSU:9682]
MTHKTSIATNLTDLDATREGYLAQMAEDLAQMADDLAEMERLAEARLRRQQSIDRTDRGDPAALVKFFEDSIRARDARMSQRQAANDSTQHMEK